MRVDAAVLECDTRRLMAMFVAIEPSKEPMRASVCSSSLKSAQTRTRGTPVVESPTLTFPSSLAIQGVTNTCVDDMTTSLPSNLVRTA